MDLQLYLLSFDVAHFGKCLLEDSDVTFKVHRLYSALYLEAIALGKEEAFLSLTRQGDILLSDAFFYDKGLYLPKPIGFPKLERKLHVEDITQARQQAKMSKKLTQIHHQYFDSFAMGEMDTSQQLNELLKDTSQFYQSTDATHVHVEGDPYRVGTVFYDEGVYLGVIGSSHDLLVDLFKSLQFSGLGGKRSAGLGQFTLTIKEINSNVAKRLTTKCDYPVMLLNSSIPVDEQLEKSMNNAHFIVEKSSGFAFSSGLKEAVRKNDLYKFMAGSTFEQTFDGNLIDVAPNDFPHPVWNYSIPLFYRLKEKADD
ncbi:type III-A CRISPR-associated RAMP protein Csm4 [Dolosicoccus paucivorans]|uniref:CRISPR system Cms protein Csm4 n=1 Tax=Dolosicoccus paucivorans TaxID=84521 RepID=A0A1G8JUQ5_9LACT|nr:type III-A CRISPR-associated RAMP protein Csm4 [Dolosicoccus paucivorans]PMB85054.1 type III-A CRISPR-associated RAMP protein Csm4 [Dolosicoccus paucivorans]PMC58990.1 type III-A CRISPR-associated RAMP protein Csm4 [Dolosicoccus paucivorans]SDI34949.1 CRISPR-associated protein, Csm4 family [Dolosicoccus paucivorans]